MANVYHHIFPWYKTRVKVDNQAKSLVQSVSVQADMGLDFFSPNNTGIGIALTTRSRDILIDINYVSNGEFLNPTECSFINDFGDIYIYSKDTSSVDRIVEIYFSGCLLVGTSSEISAGRAFGTTTEKYKARSYHVKDVSYNHWTSAAPTESGNILGQEHPSCYDPLETGQISYSSECSIDREYIYQPGCRQPVFVAIKYPITTTATIERMETSIDVFKVNPSGGFDLTSTGTASGIKGTGTMAYNQCYLWPSGLGNAIPGGYLESVEIGGMDINKNQAVTYKIKSTNDYRPELKRIIQISG